MKPNTQNLFIKSSLVNIFFLAGSTLLLFFIILSGSSNNPSTPLNKFYWVQGNTSNITGAFNTSRWTFWSVCAIQNGKSVNCSAKSGPAIPISPFSNFGTNEVGDWFVNNSNTLYYLSRVGWGFLLIAFIFTSISFLFSAISFCSLQLQQALNVFVFVSFISTITAASLFTSAIAMTKKHLPDGKIGQILVAFLWTTTVCTFIVWCINFGTCVSASYKRAKSKAMGAVDEKQSSETTNEGAVPNSEIGPLPPRTNDTGLDATYDPYATTSPQQGIAFNKVNRNKEVEV